MPTLEQLLVQTRVLSPTQLAIAQRDATVRHKRLAAAIVDLGMLDERRFAEWMAKVTELPIVDPVPAGAVEQLQHRIAPETAREYQVVPLAIDRDALTVATMNPLDQSCLDVLRHATGLRIRPVIALYGALSEALARYYPEHDEEPTLLRRPPAEPRNTVAVPSPIRNADSSPFGSETLQAGVGQPFARDAKEEDAASETRLFPVAPPPPEEESPVAKTAEESQLDRIERKIADLVHAVEKLQRRVDAMDATIARVLSRK